MAWTAALIVEPLSTMWGSADHPLALAKGRADGHGLRRPEISAGCQSKDKEGQALGRERR